MEKTITNPSNKQLVISIIIAAVAFWYFVVKPDLAPDPEPAKVEKTTISTSFFELEARYAANSLAFEKEYARDAFKLSGTVVNVGGDKDSPLVMISEGRFGVKPYLAQFNNATGLASLNPGDDINLVCGTFNEAGMMEDCSLANPH